MTLLKDQPLKYRHRRSETETDFTVFRLLPVLPSFSVFFVFSFSNYLLVYGTVR